MKKISLTFLVVTILFSASCNKNDNSNNTSSANESFSFQGTTYTVSSCTGSAQYLTATSGNTTTGPNMIVTFPGNALPTAAGTYTVVKGGFPSGANQVGITFNPTLTTVYSSTGGNGSNQTVIVNVSGGKVSVTGTNIELVGSAQSDSSGLTFNITQQ
jgi:hypothetical protein